MKKAAFIVCLSFLIFNGALFAQHLTGAYAISPDKAKLHIGEKHEVDGVFFKKEVRQTKKRDTWLILTYMSGADHTKPAFVEVKTVKVKKGDSIAWSKGGNTYLNINRELRDSKSHQRSLSPPWDEVGAAGKLILFEGLPAIKTTIEDVIIFEPVS